MGFWQDFKNRPVDGVSLIVAILGLFVTAGAGGAVFWQIRQTTTALYAQTETAVDQMTLDWDRTLVDNSDAAPYLHTHKGMPTDPPLRDKVPTVASMQLDFIDTYAGQRDFLIQGSGEEAWNKFIEKVFTSNDVMCEQYKREICQHSHLVHKAAVKFCEIPEDQKECKD